MRNKNDTYHGFTVENIRHSEELDADLWQIRYDRTGTGILWTDNGASNRLMAVCVRTLPENDTGVFHILEHTVLCGSRNYPVKEPFVELMKSSVNTYMNAWTMPDRTLYPISSRNPHDFMNLASVYLDAVFHPLSVENRNIFLQEGWHLEKEGKRYGFNGVVLNEMKGAMSEVDDFLCEKMMGLLFPDTSYGFNSGGDPARIPDLTYEDYVAAYRRFYHPSNCLIYLDGAIDLEETLDLIGSYLEEYERREDFPAYRLQTPGSREETVRFALEPEESLENKERLMLGRILCDATDTVTAAAVSLLVDVLMGTNDAPFKKELLRRELAGDVGVSIDDSGLQPYLMVDFKNVADGREEELLSFFRSFAAETAREGISREALHAAINQFEFNVYEVGEPQGLDRCSNALSGWLFGIDPLETMTFTGLFRTLRQMADEGGYEKLLDEVFASADCWCLLRALPSYTEAQEREEAERRQADALTAGWTLADKRANAALVRGLHRWQKTPDSPEALAMLPRLTLDEISPEPEIIPTVESDWNGIRVLYHPLKSRVNYYSFYFDLSCFTPEELSLLARCCGYFVALRTRRHSALELQQMCKNDLGNLSFAVSCLSGKGDPDRTVPYLILRMSVFPDKLERACELVNEVLYETEFDESDKIRNYLDQALEAMRQAPVSDGQPLAIKCSLAHYSAEDRLRNYLSGFDGMRMFRGLCEEEHPEQTIARLIGRMLKECVGRKRTVLSVTGNECLLPLGILNALGEGGNFESGIAVGLSMPENAAYPIPSPIGYSAQAYHLKECGIPFDASIRVAANLIFLDYLWSKVRVEGGAYDTGLNASRVGTIFSYSYRDPDPLRSLKINEGIPEFLRRFVASGADLTPYIISAVSGTEPLSSVRSMASTADMEWLSGWTEEDDREDRRQMLETDGAKLLEACRVFERFAQDGAVCVVAGQDVLDASYGLEKVRLR